MLRIFNGDLINYSNANTMQITSAIARKVTFLLSWCVVRMVKKARIEIQLLHEVIVTV